MLLKFLINALILLLAGCAQQTTGKTQTSDTNVGSSVVSGNQIEYIIFGKYCGRCRSGKCSPMYKLDLVNKKLSLDNSSHYNQAEALNFDKELSSEQFKLAIDLDKKIPNSLYLSTEKRFGCPDCADQCGIYLEIKKGERKYDYQLDNRPTNAAGWVLELTTTLQDLISRLQEQNK